MNLRVVAAILRKDARSLWPLALLGALLFAGDVAITTWQLVPIWQNFRQFLLFIAAALLTVAVFQADSAVSLVDDWLCRPVPRGALVAAKLLFLFLFIYLPAALGTFVVDLCLGRPVSEAIQEGLLLRDPYFPLVVPLTIFIGIMTRTLIQAAGVALALFACVFLLPAPFVQVPSPLSPSIGPELGGTGIGWLSLMPATLATLLMTCAGFWLVYWRRQLLAARVLMAAAAASCVLLVLLPMWLAPWQSVFAAQRRLAPATAPSAAAHIYLRKLRACFPATRVGDLPTNPAFIAARDISGLRPWNDEDLRDTGPDSVAFLTSVEARRLPPDWAIRFNFVQADYHVNGATTPAFSLRPAYYLGGRAGDVLSHAWVLPRAALRELEDASPSLRLRYSLTLLEPHAFSLATDGKVHELPGLGNCRATLIAQKDHVEVDCFSAFRPPAQISAELDGIPASREVTPADFAPAWAHWPYGRRVKLQVGSRLARQDRIIVTAWSVAGYLEESLELPGILGAETTACPLPTAGSSQYQSARWRDAAEHDSYSIGVEDGVQLEVLDFGGTGPAILLLPGLGATAHSFDEIAPLLARHHRVVAMTRRGAGQSSRPEHGFDTPRLAQDVLRVMDAMKLGDALLVGHSIAGEEMTWLGGHHPGRFSGLVYLDAAYDRSRDDARHANLRELTRSLPAEPPVPPRALLNYEAMSRLLAERGHLRMPEGELIALLQVDKPFLAGMPDIDARTQQAIVAALEPPDYGALKIPALAIYAIEERGGRIPPWYDPKDAQLRATLERIATIREDLQREQIEQFRRGAAQGEVLELRNARHNIILSNPREVVQAIEAFAGRVPR